MAYGSMAGGAQKGQLPGWSQLRILTPTSRHHHPQIHSIDYVNKVMPPRRRIPSFSRLKGTSMGPNTINAASSGQIPINSSLESGTEMDSRTPPGQIAFETLSLAEAAGPSSGDLAVHGEGDEEGITPKACTGHFPMNSRSSSPTRVIAPHASLLLTNRSPPRTPNKPEAKNDQRIRSERIATSPRHRSVSSTTDVGEVQPFIDNGEDWCLRLPQPSNSTVSLPHSARISTTSPSKNWVLNPETDIPCSPDFPPTDFTDLILIPKDRDVEFHVQAATVLHASPLLGDIIRPFLSSPLEGDDTEPEMDFCILEEPYEALDAILRFIHVHVAKPTVRSITHLVRLLAVCKKYEIAAGIHTLSILLIQFARMGASPSNTNILVGSPIQCYSLACKYGFWNIAKLISTNCLAVDPLKADLGRFLVGVASKEVRRLFDLHHSRGLAALRLVDAAMDAPEFWCKGCLGLASWYEFWREAAEHELKCKPISRTVFSPSFLAGCLKQAVKKCPHHCMDHYLAPKTQLRLGVLQKNIDSLRNRI